MVRCFAAVLLLVAAVSCGAVHVNSAAGLRRRAALVELGEVGTLQELPADVLSALPAGFTARQLDLNDEDLEAMREAASIKQTGAPEVRFAEAEAEAETMAVQKPCVPAGHTLSSVNEKDLPRSLREYIMSLQPCKDGESACLPKDLPNPDFHAFLPSWMRALPACGSAQYVGGSVNASAAPALPANAHVKEAVTTTRVDPSGKTITTTTVEERPTTVSVPPQPGQSIHTTTTVTTVHEVKVIHKKPRATDPPMARSAQMAVASLRASLREHKPHDEDKIVVDAVNKIIKLNNQDPRQGPVYRAAEKLPKYRDWRREERGAQNLARISLKKELEVHAGLSANATALLKAARSALARVYHLQNATRLVGTELTNAAQRVAAQANRTMEETLRAELAYAGNSPQKAFAAQLAAGAHAAALQLNQSYTELTNLLAGLASVNNDTLNLDTTSIAGYDAAVGNFNAEIAALGPKLADTVTSVEAALKNAEGPRSEQQAALKEAADVRQTIAAVQADRARWQTQVERMQERIAELDKPRE